jgi:hypothetical protein
MLQVLGLAISHTLICSVSAQMDMTAWVKAGTKEEVGVITDFTDPRYDLKGILNEFW